MAKIAYMDVLTGAPNRHAFERDLKIFVEKTTSEKHNWIIYFDCNNLKYFNDILGHQAGDDYLKFTSQSIHNTFGKHGDYYRMGGDEFSSIVYDVDETEMKQLKLELQKMVSSYSSQGVAGIAVGYVPYHPEKDNDLKSYLAKVDAMMYQDKKLTKINPPIL